MKVSDGLADVLVQRWDLYPEQMEDGRYLCRHRPLTAQEVQAHMRGEITLGVYVLDPDNRARYIVLDADDDEDFDALRSLALDYPGYLESSRRGGHLWIFFEKPVSGKVARSFGKGLLQRVGTDMELFPKQAASDGPGSLVRMPFGIHRKSGERYPFVNPDGSRRGSWLKQMEALMDPECIPMQLVEKIAVRGEPVERSQETDSNKVWDRIKARAGVMDFIGRYVELRETAGGGIGRCPFHEDHNPSFSVQRDENYWHCFAGCGGGSIIDFWMKWNNCDFPTATEELAEMLGVDDE